MQVETCRARLFALAGKDMEKDETPTVFAAWRDSCRAAIIPEVIVFP